MHTRFDAVFRISLALKGLDSLLEVIGGTILFFVTPTEIAHWGQVAVGHSHNFIATTIIHGTSHVASSSTLFGAIYLLTHGVVKLVLVIAVLKNKFWAYPLLIVVLLIFIVYQIILMFHHTSYSLIGLTIFDVFVSIMTALEWQKQIELRELTKEKS